MGPLALGIQSDSGQEVGSITWRAMALGVAVLIPNTIWVIRMERVYGGPYPTTISLFMNVVFLLCVLQAVNAVVARLAPAWAFRQAELLTVYAMLGVGTALAGLDSLTIVPQVAADPFHSATPENHWAVSIWPHLPRWLTVSDLDALKGYYVGNSTLYTPAHLRAWIPPMAAWSVFVLLMLWTMLCLNVLVRRQWQDNERLTYPLVQLPMEMTRPGSGLYRQKPFLAGAILAAALDLMNGFATWYPNVPSFNVRGVDIASMVSSRPWNAIWWMPLNYFPFVVGLGFLLPVDLLFSCWFFYLFWKAERVVFSSGGWDTASNFPYINEQCFGAYAAMVGFSIWAGRKTYGQVWRKALRRPSEIDDADEGLSYRIALFGAAAGTVALIAFSVAAGLQLWVAIVFFAMFWMLMLAIARIRAELGPPVHDLHFTGPDHMIPMAFGTTALTGGSMAVLSLFFWFNRAYRSSPMPLQTEGLAMAQRLGARQRRMTAALMLAGLTGTVAALWAHLHMAYALGAQSKMLGATGMGTEGFSRMNNWVNNPAGPEWGGTIAMGVGFALSLALMVAHTRIAGWPFHAMGFAISGSWSMNLMWFPLFLAWVCKALTIRYAGIRGYRVALTFFMGLIVGEALMGIGWTLVRFFNDIPIYNFFGQ